MEIDELGKNKSSSSRRLDFTNMENDRQHISPEETPQIGKEFDNEEEAYQFYLAYAKKAGFGMKRHKMHKDRTGKIKCRMFSRSAEGTRGEDKRNINVRAPRAITRFGCKAKMRIRLKENEKYEVFEFISENTHQLVSPQKTHFFPSHRRIDEVHASQIDMAEYVGLAPKVSHDLMIKEAGGRESLGFIRQDIKNYLRSKRTKYMEVGDTGGVLEYLQGMQNRDLNSSYSIQVDEDDMITNIFWVDGRMRADYFDFGDVVSFDTTYRKYRENRPLALFVGVNHHMQTIVFGAALLYDETIPSFEWLFDTFVNTMYGRKPTTILTDQYPAMANALASRWPETHHRLCIWHIYQNAAIHLGGIFAEHKNFAHDFGRCVHDFDEEDEFLHEWNEMLVKYNLVDNDWLRRLFNLKEKWALVYGRQFFCADITTTQRSESINSVIKRYSSSKNNLRVFFEKFENLVESRRYEQLQADFKASTSAPVLPLPIQLLKHAASVYTPEVFKIFQKELGKVYDCVGSITRSHETITEYQVSYLERSRYHIVKYDSSDKTVACSCKKFDFSGILCSHGLKILTKNDVLKIPDQYILKRWTKDARLGDLHSRMYVGDHSMDDPKNELSLRCKDLSVLCNKLVTRASENKESYEFARDALLKITERVNEQLQSRKENSDGISLKDFDIVGMNNKDNIHIKGIKNRKKVLGLIELEPEMIDLDSPECFHRIRSC
ncbi:protein FAR1-RELATED SEQUENCE 5-like [Andrographis paniculata]|uniref:protein FAR1-RELATED SEQUENCE 5-like n=1 Tax=Andrographis paniculata TaxID=175694 RepID=UPI0021E81B00|nr:protein FAR1-RELATED SEQUENCE 5-like [Andrographis paniculata]